MGGVGVNVTSGDEVPFEQGKEMEVRPGDFVNIQTSECVSLDVSDIGFVFAKVSLTRRGFTSFGSKIDPGYSGRLWLSFANNGHSIEVLRQGQPICMVSIMVLDDEAGASYVAPQNNSLPFRPVVTLSLEVTPDQRKKYERSYSRANMELFDLLPQVKDRVQKLEETVNGTRRAMVIGFLTSTVPAVVLGMLVLTLTLVTLIAGLNSAARELTDAVPSLPLVFSALSLGIAFAVLVWVLSKERRQ